jgi:diaphanous 1
MITHIAYSLHTPSLKLHTLVSELLAAICVLSLTEGHKAVLAAMSDYHIASDEAFRFESLIGSLRLPDDLEQDVSRGDEEDGVWEARAASMALVNAITNCPEVLEDRVMLREEFTRRGLNEIIVVSNFSAAQSSRLSILMVYPCRLCDISNRRILS